MAQIIKICQKHRIAFLSTYALDDEDLCCTSALLEDDCEPPETYLEAMRLIYDHPREPLMITTRDADGNITRMDAVL